MNRENEKRVVQACSVVEGYRRALVERMAEEILEQQEEFECPFLGNAEALLDKYYHLFSCLYSVSSEISAYLGDEESMRDTRE